jgi:shikimate dehydrogenase
VYGVSQALSEAGGARLASAVVLGSGATARSVVAALASLGCTKVTFAVRSGARQETLDQAGRAGLEVDVAPLGQLADALGDARLVISTLPANALGNALTGKELPHGSLQADYLLLDVVYTGWPTPLARRFQAAGARAVSGLEMLVHQGAEQVYLMTGLRPPVEAMRKAGQAALAGLPGMGQR